jgi:hypothetical protein
MPLEEEMLASAAAGEFVDCGSGPFNLIEMQAWGGERTVRAAVLRHLLIGQDWPTDARGVRLRGIRISGPLDLQAATLHCPLQMDSCILDAQLVYLDQAAATVLTITGCHLAALTGETLTAKTLDLSGSNAHWSASAARREHNRRAQLQRRPPDRLRRRRQRPGR